MLFPPFPDATDFHFAYGKASSHNSARLYILHFPDRDEGNPDHRLKSQLHPTEKHKTQYCHTADHLSIYLVYRQSDLSPIYLSTSDKAILLSRQYPESHPSGLYYPDFPITQWKNRCNLLPVTVPHLYDSVYWPACVESRNKVPDEVYFCRERNSSTKSVLSRPPQLHFRTRFCNTVLYGHKTLHH